MGGPDDAARSRTGRHRSRSADRILPLSLLLADTADKETAMTTIRTDYDALPWLPCTEMFGEAAVYRGKPIIEAKTLADRRREGGGISYLLRFSPPAGKLIKVVAIARSDEHIFNLSG